MKLYIKQAVFTLSESFEVRDEFNQVHYYVKGSFFEIPKNFQIYDSNQQHLASITSQLFRFFSHYTIESNHFNVELRRNFSFFAQNFSLTGTDWVLQGDFLSHNYRVTQGERPVMTISKHWFTWGDSYELVIDHPEDALLCLCIVVAVDAQIAKDRSN